MKQKLSLCCALIHDPDLLILDEPTTGVDPLSRGQFWDLINTYPREASASMSVIVATAYMEEAARFDWLVAMDAGKIIASGTTPQILQKTGEKDSGGGLHRVASGSRARAAPQGGHACRARPATTSVPAIEADGLTRRFGNFTAVDHVSIRIAPRRDLRLSRLERQRQDQPR